MRSIAGHSEAYANRRRQDYLRDEYDNSYELILKGRRLHCSMQSVASTGKNIPLPQFDSFSSSNSKLQKGREGYFGWRVGATEGIEKEGGGGKNWRGIFYSCFVRTTIAIGRSESVCRICNSEWMICEDSEKRIPTTSICSNNFDLHRTRSVLDCLFAFPTDQRGSFSCVFSSRKWRSRKLSKIGV